MTTFWSAIINGAASSAALIFAVWLILRFTPRRSLNAATRYAIWWIVLAITIALPLAYIPWRTPSPPRSTAMPVRDIQWVANQTSQAQAHPALALPITIPANQSLRPILVVWVAASLLLLARMFVSYAALFRRSARARSLESNGLADQWMAHSGSTRRVRLAISDEIGIPVATGPVRPTILIPSELFSRMTAKDLEQIGRHEAAHLSRRDDYALFVQRAIEAVFALHPLARWITRQIELEREIACDDIAVGSPESARGYADCLTRTVVMCGGVRTSLAAANVADGRSHLTRRVELLLDSARNGRTGLLRTQCAAMAMALLAATACLARTPMLFAFYVPHVQPALPKPFTPQPSLTPPPQPRFMAQATPPPAANNFEEQRTLGNKQIADRQFDDAIAILQSLIAASPDDATRGDVWSRIGEAYRYKGDFASAIQAMENAAKLLPNSASVNTNLALLYEASNDLSHARVYYERAIAIDPNNPLALNNLAYLLTETNGDLDLALTYANAAKEKLPNFLEVRDTLGWIYLKRNQPSDAVNEFRTLTEKAPNNPIYHYHYAMALNQQGNKTDAAKECQAALSNNPKLPLETDIFALMKQLAN